MHVSVASLNSGSNGNCYYVGNAHEAVLIDAGLSCRETEKRMRMLNLSMLKVKAVFISHEHIDHIKGVEVLARKYQIPVYITEGTLRNSREKPDSHLLKTFTAYENVQIGSFYVKPFPKYHDAADPHSFVVSYDNVHIGVFTDIGAECEHLIKHFKQCHAAFLEANYDEKMLEEGRYPYHLKNRIRGGHGHLSNRQALELFLKHKPAHMSHLFLAHLSKENNDPSIVYELFCEHAGNTHIAIASRYEPMGVFDIFDTREHGEPKMREAKLRQASLF